MTEHHSRTAEIRQRAKVRDGEAEILLRELLRDLFGIEARDLRINHDQYSLNSLNGFFVTDEGEFFFKFHQEDGEEAMSGEYYRADILAKAGLPVDQPVLMSVLPGEQILVYRRRHDPRFSDVLRRLDMEDDPSLRDKAVRAERALSRDVLKVYRETLHPITPDEAAAEPVNRLFFERLIDPATGAFPGGRFKGFYVGQNFEFPGVTLPWEEFSTLLFRVNGVEYSHTIGALFEEAHARLNPARLADAGGVTAHGDAHNANVWFHDRGADAALSFFDPAFAGENVPTLLAEVKTTFHNVLAHPFWLYDPATAAEKYTAAARVENGVLDVTTSWRPSPVREALLHVKAADMWRPLLQELAARGMLPADWRRAVRLGLFLCPTLVMNLRAGATSHNPISSLIGFSMAAMAGGEPVGGADFLSRFFDAVDPASAA